MDGSGGTDVSAVITTVVAVVSALVALGALFFTGLQVKIAQRQTALQERMREDQAQPYVWADIRPSPQSMHLMMLMVKNEGPTVARDVSVTFDPPLPRVVGIAPPTSDRYTVSGMPPGRVMSWHLNTGPDWLNSDLPKRFTVTVNATGPYGPVGPTVYDLDVDEYRLASATPPGTLNGVSERIKALTKAVQDWQPPRR